MIGIMKFLVCFSLACLGIVGALKPVYTCIARGPRSHLFRNQASMSDSANENELSDYVDSFCRGTNAAFEKLVIPPVRDYVRIQKSTILSDFEKITAPPQLPGIPRGVTLTVLASIPTALGWYGYYKFCTEEELFQDEIARTGKATGFGGYGTLFPFVYSIIIGFPMALFPFGPVHDLGGTIVEVGGAWILFSQINLYRRVNELLVESGEESPLHAWWAILPPPLDVIVGLRQVHFLAKYWSSRRGEDFGKDYIAEELFPFISSERFTLKELVTQPRRWFWFTKDANDINL